MLDQNFAKWIMAAGCVLFVFGAILQWSPSWLKLGNLPGDFYFKSEGGSSFYFPMTTSILLSVLFSLLWSAWKKWL